MKIANTINPVYCLIFFFFILSQAAFAQQLNLGNNSSKRTLALIIGISDYAYLNNLQFAHEDAEDFANFLKSEEGLNLPESDVVVYTNEQATRSNVLYNGFNWLYEELNEGDEAFIFFSGHADISNKENIDLERTGYLMTYESEKDKFETTALSMNTFLTKFNNLRRGKKASTRVILDVCHAGFGLEPQGFISTLEFQGKYKSNKEIIITSCRSNEQSYEYEKLQNGCFSYFFLQGCKGAADFDKDLNITLGEIKKYSEDNVKRYVELNKDPAQIPQFKGDDSHLIARLDNPYQAEESIVDNSSGKTKKGVRKGIDSNAKKRNTEVKDILEKTKDSSLSGKKIQKDLKVYLELPEETLDQQTAKRKMKRELIAAMVDNADESIAAYFEREDELMNNPLYTTASEYYLMAANLLGEDNFLYRELLGKYFFMEALKLKAIDPNDSKVIDNLNSSLTIDSFASYTLNELGNVYFAKNEFELALKYYEQANNISPIWGKNIIKTKKAISSNPSTSIPIPYEMTATSKPKPAPANGADVVFNIQLAAAGKVNRAEFKNVEDLGPINPEFHPDKELIITWLGPFNSEKEARVKLKKAKDRGFKDAFLVETIRDTSFQKKLAEKKIALGKKLAASMPYQVRIAAVKTYNKADFAKLEKIGNVEAEQVIMNGKTFFRVLMYYNSKKEAVATLQKIKNEGFQDAYVFENKAQNLEAQDTKVLPSSYEHTMANPTEYKIRVATVSKLVENQFANLEDLGQIYMDVIHDKGLIRISLGVYYNKKQATEVLNKVKKMGYKDAFIQF